MEKVVGIIGEVVVDKIQIGMKKFNDLNDLIKNIDSLDWDGGIFCNIENWNNSPSQTVMYFISSEEEMESEEDEQGEPKIWSDYSVRPLFTEVETFKDVIDLCKSGDYIKCINHYREFDSFLEE